MKAKQIYKPDHIFTIVDFLICYARKSTIGNNIFSRLCMCVAFHNVLLKRQRGNERLYVCCMNNFFLLTGKQKEKNVLYLLTKQDNLNAKCMTLTWTKMLQAMMNKRSWQAVISSSRWKQPILFLTAANLFNGYRNDCNRIMFSPSISFYVFLLIFLV